MPQPLTYRRCASVDTSAVSDRVILFERGSRRTLVLNPTGSALWHELASPRTPDELANWLQSRFPTLNPEQTRRDVETYLSELLNQQLIQSAS